MNANAKHTPGPWVIDDRPIYDSDAGMHAKPSERGACIASVETAFSSHAIHAPATIGYPCPSINDWNDAALANAHLIAAAPELLEALRRLVQCNEEWNADVQTVVGRVPSWTDGYLDTARAAISKAEGR